MLNVQLPKGASAIRSIMSGEYIPTYLMGGVGTPVQQSLSMQEDAEEQARQSEYLVSRERYDGHHSTKLTARGRQYMLSDGDEDGDVNINVEKLIVDIQAARLKVTGIDAGESGQGETLWEYWRDNRMDAKQGIIHTAALRDGDVYLMVQWDNEEKRPECTVELACAGGEGAKVVYDNETGKPSHASKRWKTVVNGQKARRLNLYFADHIEKYLGSDGNYGESWSPYLLDGGIETQGSIGTCGWHWWTDTGASTGEPLGIPIVHFKNRDQGYHYGQSEMISARPIQNGINKLFVDGMQESDYSAGRILFARGEGWGSLEVHPGVLLHSPDPNSALEAIEGQSPDGALKMKDSLTLDAARVTQTPGSAVQITAERPAEGTLQQEESGLIAKTEKCQTDFGNTYEDMFKRFRVLHNAYSGKPKMDPKQRIETVWKEAQTRNEKAHLETLTMKKALGVPEEQIWREMGYNDGQIASFKAIKFKAEQRAIRDRLSILALPPGQPTGGPNDAPTQPAGTGQAAGQPAIGAAAKAA